MPAKTKEQKTLHAALRSVKRKLRVTKVVCTRSVKSRGGDHYVGFSAGWDTVQDDAGGAADLAAAQDDEAQAVHDSGMTLREARLAAHVLGMQADIAAHDAAFAGGAITEEAHHRASRAIKANYSQLMTELFTKSEGGD